MAFTLQDARPAPVSKLSIMVGGREVGHIDAHPNRQGEVRCHAVLQVGSFSLGCGLAQGHGDTPETAIADAFIASRADAQNYLHALAELEKALRTEGTGT